MEPTAGRVSGILDRLQTTPHQYRWRHPRQRHPHLGLDARLPSGDPVVPNDPRAYSSVPLRGPRPDFAYERPGILPVLARPRACAPHRFQSPPQSEPPHPAERRRFAERSTAERINSNLKDNYGGKLVRVRGAAKVMCHLTSGLLSLTAVQLFHCWNKARDPDRPEHNGSCNPRQKESVKNSGRFLAR